MSEWRKSSWSVSNGACVEARPTAGGVAVRDSTDPDGPRLVLTPQQWGEFLAQVKTG